jgi:hypothetical protein
MAEPGSRLGARPSGVTCVVLLVLAARPAPARAPAAGPTGVFASASGATIWDHPQLRGVLVRASWSSLEPSPGSFELSALRARIAEVTSHGKSWSLAVGAGGPGTPAWLVDSLGAPFVDYAFRGTPMRLPLFWSPVVKERLRSLAARLGQELSGDPSLKLVYVTQMTANGIEGHLQGVDMTAFARAGYTDDLWVGAALDTAAAFAEAFPTKALAFEVHDVNGGVSVPARILDGLRHDARLGGRTGAAVWWVSGRTDYQAALLDVVRSFPGEKYGQVIARSDDATRFANGDYATVFAQAKELGLRYLEPWEHDFGTGAGTANGRWDALLRDFNAWADSYVGPRATWIVPSSARAPGAGGAFYTTDLVLANPGGDASVTLRFLGHDGDGRGGKTFPLAIPAGSSRTVDDVLLSGFGEAEAWGAIQVASDEPALVVAAGTSTPFGSGSFGQSVPAFGDDDRLESGGRWTIAGVREDGLFRTNLVLANGAEVECTVEVSLFADDGRLLASTTVTLPPLGMKQLSRVVRALGVADAVSGARLSVSTLAAGASLAAYAALVDETTNDPRTLLPR